MLKYNAVVSYPINKNGHETTRLVTVYYDEKYEEDEEDEKIIGLSDLKINLQNTDLTFSIEGSGIILKKNHIKKTIFK